MSGPPGTAAPSVPARPPMVVAHVRDLLFSSRIGETARRLGYRVRATRSLDDLRGALADRPALVLLDLAGPGVDAPAALAAVEAAGRPAPVLGWTTHAAWRSTAALHGRCDRVVTREALTAELPALLRGFVEASPAASDRPEVAVEGAPGGRPGGSAPARSPS